MNNLLTVVSRVLISIQSKRVVGYYLSAVRHLIAGRLTFNHFLYALKERPIVVRSKGNGWVIDPSFEG